MTTTSTGHRRHTHVRLPARLHRHAPTEKTAHIRTHHAGSGAHAGPGSRLVERMTRRWTLDLYDMDLQFESGDLKSDLQYGRR
ncbi:hypothetical protein [Demequina sp. SO4-18]|uniref:hypothetical protein n=1 Tax=Demequina sp. SO4-18 TaxID=3401026 RepID=UPI003B5B4B43